MGADPYEGFSRGGVHEGRLIFHFVVLSGFHRALPRKSRLAALHVAEDPDGEFPGRENVWKGCLFGDLPTDFKKVGERSMRRARPFFFTGEGTSVFQDGEHLRTALFRQWRLVHDRSALEAELAQQSARREKRVDERRRTLTLPRMLRESIFANWTEMWGSAVVREARRIFRDATRDLIALQDGGTKRQRTAVLRRIVREFNDLDHPTGCIESVERDQIIRRIEELARLVGVSNENEALTRDRDW